MVGIAHRMNLADLANVLQISNVVEIGTHQAFFAREFMERFNGSITLVDPWKDLCPEFGTFFPNDAVYGTRNEDMEHAINVMSKFGDRVKFLQTTSKEANEQFADDSVGMAYIDGLHDADHIQEDIRLWWPKVTRGGIFAGHDFFDELPDVVQAVQQHFERVNVPFYLTEDHPPSWWSIKQ